jgi:hypothetical protein
VSTFGNCLGRAEMTKKQSVKQNIKINKKATDFKSLAPFNTYQKSTHLKIRIELALKEKLKKQLQLNQKFMN